MNVIFDIGKVLIDFDWDAFIGGMYDKKTAAAVTEAMWHNPDWTELDRGVLSDEEVLRLFITKAPQYETEIRHTFSKLGECPVQKPSTVPMIEKLKCRGYGVYYLSNYFEYLMHTAPEALDFIKHTDGGVFSCHVRETKPDRRRFEIICGKYSLIPTECVFIDDTLKNVAAAEAFGMKGIHYTGQDTDTLCGEIDSIFR